MATLKHDGRVCEIHFIIAGGGQQLLPVARAISLPRVLVQLASFSVIDNYFFIRVIIFHTNSVTSFLKSGKGPHCVRRFYRQDVLMVTSLAFLFFEPRVIENIGCFCW